MQLRHFTLTNHELHQLIEVVALARDDRSTSRLLSSLFDEFLRSNSISLTPVQKTRVLSVPTMGRYRDSVILYDFIISSFLRHLQQSNNHNNYDKLIAKILKLMESRRLSLNSDELLLWAIQSQLNLFDKIEPIPSNMFGDYFGYRRSSTVGNIIRFFIELKQSPEPNLVRFVNHYERYDDRWTVTGVGYFVKQTLYLVGHARNPQNNASLGLRLFAIRQLGTSNILVGPLISMDGQGPIAARVALVPRALHQLNQKQSAFRPEELIEHMIKFGSDQRDERELTAEILFNLERAFDGVPADRLFDLICNATFTVVKGAVLESDKSHREFINIEKQYRELAEINDWDFRQRILTILRAGISGGHG